MGWFFNKDNTRNDQSSQSRERNDQQSFFKETSSFYSKKRKCQNDPEDDRYMICKTVIKDNNGTREEEERLPKNQFVETGMEENNGFNFSSSFNGGEGEDQKAFDKFMSFFIQPSFFDFHNSTPQTPNEQIQSYSSSFSKSRSCHTDPEDSEYLICKSKVFDGKQTKEIEERVKASDQLAIPSFRQQFGNIGQQVDKEIHNLMRDINRGFNFVSPLIGPMMSFINQLENLDKPRGPAKNVNIPGYFPKDHSQATRNGDNSESKYFTASKAKKDTNVYDL